jgi:predicted acylesterase/phospholipase RssA
MNITRPNCYVTPTLFNLLYNSIFTSGVLNNAPEESLLARVYGQRGHLLRPVTVGVTDATRGQYTTLDLDKLDDMQQVIHWTKASTSIPAVFQSMVINGTVYVDGGVM